MAQSGERSEAALRNLKGTRDRVRKGQTASGGEMPEVEEQAPVPVATRKRRFDVGDAAAKQTAGDISAALGGAKRADEAETLKKPAQTGEAPASPESMTERLLRTKRKGKE